MTSPNDHEPPAPRYTKPPRRYWKATEPFCDLKLSHWVTIGLTVALVVVYLLQANIMRWQLGEMEFQRRPWVWAKVAVSDPLTYRDSEARVGLQFKLRDTGVTPAYQAHVEVSGFPEMPNFRTDPGTRCHNPPANYPSGVSVFPGAVWKLGENFPIDIKNKAVIAPYIVVCTFYRFAGERDWHHTPAIYELRMKRSAIRPDRACCGFGVSDGSVPAESMELQSVPYGRDIPN